MSNPNLDPILSDLLFLESSDITSDGKIIPLPEDEGKVGMIFVFATWCPNCTPSKPEFAALKDKIDPATTQLYVINGSGNRGPTPTRPSEQDAVKKLEMVKGFPSFLLVDKTGKITGMHNGERKTDAFLNSIKSLL